MFYNMNLATKVQLYKCGIKIRLHCARRIQLLGYGETLVEIVSIGEGSHSIPTSDFTRHSRVTIFKDSHMKMVTTDQRKVIESLKAFTASERLIYSLKSPVPFVGSFPTSPASTRISTLIFRPPIGAPREQIPCF